MIVTINTDASFHPEYSIGAYAFWIVCNQGKIVRSGELKKAENSTDAEIRCIANALHCLKRSHFTGISKIVGIGLNYRAHALEAKMPIPAEPIVFMKATTCITGAGDPIIKPADSTKLDWEVELGIVIGRETRRVDPATALDHVAGYCVFHDVSERAFQIERGGTWDKGKGCDTFGPVGPWLVTADEVPDPQELDMWLDVNGHRYQKGSTRMMIFGVAQLVSYVSRFMTLYPGDLITTGTPPGVGLGQKPPKYLEVGDRMRLGIEGLGEQHQVVVAARG